VLGSYFNLTNKYNLTLLTGFNTIQYNFLSFGSGLLFWATLY